MAFCVNCGAALNEGAGETKLCSKCAASPVGSPNPGSERAVGTVGKAMAEKPGPAIHGAASQPGAPATKSRASILKLAVIGIALVVVVVVGNYIFSPHRATQKSAAVAGGDNVNNGAADLAAAANAAAQNAGGQAAATPSNPAGGPSAGTSAATALPPPPSVVIVPVAATGDHAHDWALEYERTEGGPDADLVVRTGDINNLGFGWPTGFDPFSGESTSPHPYPWNPPQGSPPGTDRILMGSAVTKEGLDDPNNRPYDGYSGIFDSCYPYSTGRPPCQKRLDSMPVPITLDVGALPAKIDAVLFQIFVDDFQAPVFKSHFQVSVNGTRIPSFEDEINALDQTGPIGKLVTMKLLPEYWPLLQSGTIKLLIDDPTTGRGDGYAIDFVRILVNPHKFKYEVSLTASVLDADKHTPIAGATVTAALESGTTDRSGKCELKGIPAGLVVASANAPGYDENSVQVDLAAGQTGKAEIQLHPHEESTAALEKSIAQTGTATIYGIHFDTDSSKLRADSAPALGAVLGLVNNHPGSRWLIAGHTDNQGDAGHNQTLSEARAESVVAWLKDHGVDVNRLVPQGFGATRPVADNATSNGRAMNRRVEVAVAPAQ